jgi:hypothetical protein
MALLTANGLRAKWPGKDRWLYDGTTRGHGSLVARIMRTGVTFYFQYVNSSGRQRLLPLGSFDVDGKCGLSLLAARGKAASISELYRSGIKDLHEYLERRDLEAEIARQKEQENAERERQVREDAANRYSLKKLLAAYVTHLRASGKVSADDVENIFKNHVLTAPDLPQRIAAEVSTDDWVGIVGKVVAAGHGRTAAKLRSYARARAVLLEQLAGSIQPSWRFLDLLDSLLGVSQQRDIGSHGSAPFGTKVTGGSPLTPTEAIRDARHFGDPHCGIETLRIDTKHARVRRSGLMTARR